MNRCQRSCAELGRGMRYCAVVACCWVFNDATGVSPVEISTTHDFRRWWVQPAGSEDLYQIRDSQLVPLGMGADRWRSPVVQDAVIQARTPWRKAPVPVKLPFRCLSELVGSKSCPLATLLRRRARHVLAGEAEPHGGRLVVALGQTRGWLQSILEPLPSLKLELRPPCVARVAATAVLFAWLAIGQRTLVWLVMCSIIGGRFVPIPILGLSIMTMHHAAHQVQRRLTRHGMLRRRPLLEADALVIGLLVIGAWCARGCNCSETLAAAGWACLAATWLAVMVTVAQPPQGIHSVRARAAALLHGCQWAMCGAFFCLLAAAPELRP